MGVADDRPSQEVRCARCNQSFRPPASPTEDDDLLALAGGGDVAAGPPAADDIAVLDDEDEPPPAPKPTPDVTSQPVRRPGEIQVQADDTTDPYDLVAQSGEGDAATAVPAPSAGLAPEMEWVVRLNSGGAVLCWVGGACLVGVGAMEGQVSLPMAVACATGLTLAWIGKILWTSGSMLKASDPAWHRLNLYLPLAWAVGLLGVGYLLHQGDGANFHQYELGRVFGIGYVLLFVALLVGMYTVWIVHVRQPYRFISPRKGRAEIIPVHMMLLALLAVVAAGTSAYLELQPGERRPAGRQAPAPSPRVALPSERPSPRPVAPKPPARASRTDRASAWRPAPQITTDDNDWFEIRGPADWPSTRESTGESSWVYWQDRPRSPSVVLEVGCVGKDVKTETLLHVGNARFRARPTRRAQTVHLGGAERVSGPMVVGDVEGLVLLVRSSATGRRLVFRMRCPAARFRDVQRQFNNCVVTCHEVQIPHKLEGEAIPAEWVRFRAPIGWRFQQKRQDQSYRAEFFVGKHVQMGLDVTPASAVGRERIHVCGRPLQRLIPRLALRVETPSGEKWQYFEGPASDAKGEKSRIAALETTAGDRRYVAYLKALVLDLPTQRTFLREWVKTLALTKPAKPEPKPGPVARHTAPPSGLSPKDQKRVDEIARLLEANGLYGKISGRVGWFKIGDDPRCVAFQLGVDGRYLYSAVPGGTSRVVAIDVRTGREAASVRTEGRVTAMVVSPRTGRVVFGCQGGRLRTFSLDEFRDKFVGGRSSPGPNAHGPPDMASAGGDLERTIRVSGRATTLDEIDAMAVTPDGEAVVIAGRTGVDRGPAAGGGPGPRPRGRPRPRPRRVMRGSTVIEYWQVDPPRRLGEIKERDIRDISQLGFTPDGKALAIAGHGHMLALIAWETKKPLRKIATRGKAIRAFDFGRKMLAIANTFNEVSVWALGDNGSVRPVKRLSYPRETILSVKLIDDDRYLCVGKEDGLLIYDVRSKAWDRPTEVRGAAGRSWRPGRVVLLPGTGRLLASDTEGRLCLIQLSYFGVDMDGAGPEGDHRR